MATFEYKAKKSPAEIITGQVTADSQSGAIAKLSEMGLYPILINESAQTDLFNLAKITLSFKWLIFFTREIADLLNSGVSIIKALELISAQTPHRRLKFIACKITEKVRDGSNFSDSLKLFPGVFSALYVNAARSGEVSGTLEKVMSRLSGYYEKNQKLKSKIIDAMIYPAFLVFMGFLAIFVLTFFVIPKLIPVFDDMHAQLPFITIIIIKFSHALISFWYVLLSAGIMTILIIAEALKNKNFQVKLQYGLLKIYLIKDIITNRYLSEIFQSLESLISNGIPALKAIQITEESSAFAPFKEAFKKIIIEITNGDSFSKSLENCSLFPSRIAAIIRVGEESGKLENAVKKLADGYSEAFEKTSNILTRFAGPAFIIIIAFFIGIIVVALLLPILNINVSF